jgi:hypothetical protein
VTWWQFGAAGLLLKGAAALTLVSLPELALPTPDPAAPGIVVEVRCEPMSGADSSSAVPATAPVICTEHERPR